MSLRLSLALLVLGTVSTPVLADDVPATEPAPMPVNRAHMGDDAGRRPSGRIAINQAAGTGNAQINLTAIALTPDGLGLVGLQSRQTVLAGTRDRDASARIDGDAFGATDGLLSINQAAGAGNAQANLIAIGQGGAGLASLGLAQGIAGLEDAALASIAGDAPIEGPAAATPLREAVIAGGALRDTRGVTQINQTAGVGNRSANAIVLLLPGGSP
jgi:hypothetical protein